ncbi:PEP/pyruvate-binding domain-containing protein [Desulfonatronum parangueonense]
MTTSLRELPGFAAKTENKTGVFAKRYKVFKDLLEKNNSALKVINDVEDMMLNPDTFDYNDVVAHCEQLVAIVRDLSSDLHVLSLNRHAGLKSIADRIGRSVLKELRGRQKLEKSNWTISLTNLSREKSALVGNKAANLADISNRVHLPTPKGFVVTAYSCHHFLKQMGIYEKVSRKLRHLDVRDMKRLEAVCNDIKALILGSPLPDEISEAVLHEAGVLAGDFGGNVRFAVRSSASAEDFILSSFAGQYDSVLNVSVENLLFAYKEVVAGIYNPRAVLYRREKGYRDIDDLMSVLCMIMVDAVSSGCMYTIDPNYHLADDICINANWGLGVSIVDGSARTDYWRICRESKSALVEEIAKKDSMLVMGREQHLRLITVPSARQSVACLSADQLRTLTYYGLKLEEYFDSPLDIEWALDKAGKIIILQARPLQRVAGDVPVVELEQDVHVPKEHILIHAGMTAAPGAACAPAYVLEDDKSLADIPEGCILVARQTSPTLVPAMSRVKGIVTDVGSVTGHMASVAREFKIPTLVGTETGTATIRSGETITLDATRRTIYKDQVSAVLRNKAPVNLIADSPVYIHVRGVLKKVVPLNLLDPRSSEFVPEGCTSLHDVIRFAHEMAMHEMFHLGDGLKDNIGRIGRKIRDTPLNAYVLDLGGGIEKKEIFVKDSIDIAAKDISSIPFKALLKGVTHEGVQWSGPLLENPRSLESAISRAVANDFHKRDVLTEPNYAIISKRYLNFNARLGCHFATIDSFCSEQVNSNFVTFTFKGGAADIGRRTRRAQLMAMILQRMGFRVEHKGDLLKAEMRKYDTSRLTDKLEHIGRLLGSVRLLKMVLTDDGELQWYVNEFFKGN